MLSILTLFSRWVVKLKNHTGVHRRARGAERRPEKGAKRRTEAGAELSHPLKTKSRYSTKKSEILSQIHAISQKQRGYAYDSAVYAKSTKVSTSYYNPFYLHSTKSLPVHQVLYILHLSWILQWLSLLNLVKFTQLGRVIEQLPKITIHF